MLHEDIRQLSSNSNKMETFISFGSLNDDSINEIDDIEIISKTNDDGVKSSNEEKFFYKGTLTNSSISISELSNENNDIINKTNDNEIHVSLYENAPSEKDLEVQVEELIQNETNDERFLKQMVIQSNVYYQKKLQSNENIIYKLYMTIVYIQIKKKIYSIKKQILLNIRKYVSNGKCFRKGRACLQMYTCYTNITQLNLTRIYFQYWKIKQTAIPIPPQLITVPTVPQGNIPIPPMIPNPPILLTSSNPIAIPIPIPPPPLILSSNGGVPPLPGKIPSLPINANTINNNPHNVFTNPPTKQMNVHRFQWNPIDKKKTQKCFWLTNIPEIKESVFNIKYDLLLAMFTQFKDDNINNNKQNHSNQKQTSTPTTIKILDDKRIMQLSISFTKLPFTFNELKQSLLTYNKSNILSLETLSTLLHLFPKQDEITLLQQYRKDNVHNINISLLGKPETFYYMLLDIPHSKQIIQFLHFEQMTLMEHNDILNKLKIIQNTSNEIICSLSFKVILFILLRIGNFLNYGYIKGNAYGFKINSLNIIDGVKTFTKDKQNLLDFLIINIKHMNVNNTYKGLLSFYEDFPSLKNAIEIDLNDVDRRISVIDKGINDIENEIAKEIESEMEYKMFLNEMVVKIKNVFTNINQQKQSMQNDIDKLVEMFGEEKDKFKFTEFVKNVHNFCEKFKNAVIKHTQEENRKCKQRYQKCFGRNSSNKNNFQNDYNKIRETVTKKTNENYINNNNNKFNIVINSNYFDLDAKYNDNTNHAKPVRVTQYKGKQFIEQNKQITKNELTTTADNSNLNNQNNLSFSLIVNDVLEHNTNQNKGFAVERLIK